MDDPREYTDNLIDPNAAPDKDIDSERAVLCLCLSHDKAREKCGKSLVKEDFSDNRNSVIYDCILSLYMRSVSIDRYTVADALDENGNINKAGGREYLYGIADMVAVLSNLDDYVNSVVEKSRLRKVNQALKKYVTMASTGHQSADSLIDASVTASSASVATPLPASSMFL